MKKFYAFLVIIFFAIYTNAQPTNTNVSNDSNNKKTTSDKNPKLILPPEKANPVKITKISTLPVIDGKLDDEIWKTATVFKDFIQTGPGDNVEPSKPTEAYLAYDEKNLYIAFKCWDERDKIRATLAKRDEVLGEDNVRVWLDTYNDQRRAYVLGFNPLGIQQDGIFTEGQGPDFSVDIVMESKGVIEDWGWSVEVKIPFKSLRYSAGKGKFWGFNVARNIDRLNDEFDSWMPDDRNISGFLIKHGKIGGLDEIKTERTLEITPSVTISESGRRLAVYPNTFDSDRFVNQSIKQDIGVTLKYTITPNITLDAAYNPDFAEIEADAPVVTANQRFPIFFQEKRPFFLEGSEIFGSPLQVFYSRTIVDPDLAAKLTGKIGKTSFGFLAASDNAPGNYDEDERNNPNLRPRISEFLDKNALFGVLRLKRDFGKENNVGFFGTYRSFPEQHNILGGFDGRFKLNPNTTSQFQVVGTNSRRCFFDATFEPTLNPFQARRNREICDNNQYRNYRTGNGFGYTWNLDYTEKNRGFYLETSGRTRDYRADAGFTRRTNTNSIFLAGRLSTEPKPKSKIIRIDWRPAVSTKYDWQGRSQDVGLSSNFNFSFQHNTFANFQTGVFFERIFEEEFGLKRSPTRNGAFFGEGERSTWQQYVSGSINSQINKKVAVGLFIGTINNAFDFDFGGGYRFPRRSPAYLAYLNERLINPNAVVPPLDPGPGRQFDLGFEVELKPIDPLRVSLEYNKNTLKRYDTSQTAFDSNIVTLRSTYQFTRFLFTRLRADYNSLSSNVSGQFLVGYNPSPGTAFYVGYNDNFNYNGFNPYSGQLEPRFERNNRTFFIRASYLFRKSF
ncbi:MAG: carbohydrate binding family 9 domain-containing protein [Acidobacteria bacterium]|jgi:hypothetical protein|nr:carbohydrate binding family 9 domain-containing protein [Acidobacteriota bacterium]